MSKEESEEKEVGKDIVAQVVNQHNLKTVGGLRIHLDIPEANDADICYMVLLANKQAYVTITVKPYDKEEPRKGGFGRPQP